LDFLDFLVVFFELLFVLESFLAGFLAAFLAGFLRTETGFLLGLLILFLSERAIRMKKGKFFKASGQAAEHEMNAEDMLPVDLWLEILEWTLRDKNCIRRFGQTCRHFRDIVWKQPSGLPHIVVQLGNIIHFENDSLCSTREKKESLWRVDTKEKIMKFSGIPRVWKVWKMYYGFSPSLTPVVPNFVFPNLEILHISGDNLEFVASSLDRIFPRLRKITIETCYNCDARPFVFRVPQGILEVKLQLDIYFTKKFFLDIDLSVCGEQTFITLYYHGHYEGFFQLLDNSVLFHRIRRLRVQIPYSGRDNIAAVNKVLQNMPRLETIGRLQLLDKEYVYYDVHPKQLEEFLSFQKQPGFTRLDTRCIKHLEIRNERLSHVAPLFEECEFQQLETIRLEYILLDIPADQVANFLYVLSYRALFMVDLRRVLLRISDIKMIKTKRKELGSIVHIAKEEIKRSDKCCCDKFKTFVIHGLQKMSLLSRYLRVFVKGKSLKSIDYQGIFGFRVTCYTFPEGLEELRIDASMMVHDIIVDLAAYHKLETVHFKGQSVVVTKYPKRVKTVRLVNPVQKSVSALASCDYLEDVEIHGYHDHSHLRSTDMSFHVSRSPEQILLEKVLKDKMYLYRLRFW